MREETLSLPDVLSITEGAAGRWYVHTETGHTSAPFPTLRQAIGYVMVWADPVWAFPYLVGWLSAVEPEAFGKWFDVQQAEATEGP